MIAPKPLLAVLVLVFCCVGPIRILATAEPVDLVDPLISSDSGRWFFFNAATRPEGMVNPCPDTWVAGYGYKSNEVRRFSLIHFYHVAGPAFMPVSGDVDPTHGWEGWKSDFEHADEMVEVGYHKVHLDRYQVTVECTASERAAFFRLAWGQSGAGAIVFDFKDEMHPDEAQLTGGALRRVGDRELEGYVDSTNIRQHPSNRVFMVVQFDTPIQVMEGWSGTDRLGALTEVEGSDAGAIVRLPVVGGRPLGMKVGVSYCSTANARANIAAEIDHWDFDAVRRDAREAWNQRLSRIEVEGGTPEERTKFYTDLFHALLGRGKIDDANGQFPDYTSGTLVVRTLPPAVNLAPLARVAASSSRSPASGAFCATDGITAIDGVGEWTSAGEPNPSIRLEWEDPQNIGRIDLYDRVDPGSNARRGVLSFSDGSSIDVNGLAPDGSTREVIFPPREVTWAEFRIEDGDGPDVGLSEMRAYDAASGPDHHMYNTDAFWWTFMNLNILWGIAWPDVLADYLKADLLWYEVDGLHRLPRCVLAGTADWTMTGLHAVPLLAAGIAMDLPGFDQRQALEAMRAVSRRTTQEYPAAIPYWSPLENLFGEYLKYGYVPHEADGVTDASKTMEHSFTDWCVAQAALKLGREDIHDEFIRRSASWKVHYDPRLGYMRPRNRDGTWTAPFDPILSSMKGFCEANGVQYTWFCSHDVQGLCNLMGGNDRYCEKLDWHFRQGEPVSFVDDYGGVRMISYSNQPGLHNAHLFNYAGRPWLSQKWARRVRELAFGSVTTSNAGYCQNDEDQGQLGSLSALMAIGLYSARGVIGNPPIYEITSPIFDRVTIHLDPRYYPGRDFVITAQNNSVENMYIQSARLNGQSLDQCWFPQRTFAAGGELELVLGPEPNTKWGVSNLPPSESKEAPIPPPELIDLARGRKATCDSSRKGAPAALAFDGDPLTGWTPDAGPYPHWVAVDLGSEQRIDLARLEFGDQFPQEYALQVSTDGETWIDAATAANNVRETPCRLHALAPVQARYVRLRATAGPEPQFCVQEMRVFAAEDTAGGPVAASPPQ